MSHSTTTRTGTSRGPRASLGATAKVFSRLVPKQLSDEINIALLEMKTKGIQVGIAAAFFVVGLVFLAFLVVMLLVALVSGVANWFSWDYWLAALVVGAVFLILLVVLALIGLSRLRKALPLKPERAIRGLRWDAGVLTKGRAFDERSLDEDTRTPEQKAEAQRKAQEKERQKAEKKAANPSASEPELVTRTGQRRAHLANLRDDLGRKLDVKSQWAAFTGRAREKAETLSDDVATRLHTAQRATPGDSLATVTTASGAEGTRTVITRHGGEPAETLKDRWVPLSVFAVSSGAFAVFARKLIKKS